MVEISQDPPEKAQSSKAAVKKKALIARPRKGAASRKVMSTHTAGRDMNYGGHMSIQASSKADAERSPTNAVFGDTRAKSKRTSLVYRVAGVRTTDPHKIIKKIRSGFNVKSVQILEEEYGASRKTVAGMLNIPVSTLARRQENGRLKSDESDRVLRLARLKESALDMMDGDNDAAIAWLKTPLPILNSESPVQYASNTELGCREVESLIGRINHGVFS